MFYSAQEEKKGRAVLTLSLQLLLAVCFQVRPLFEAVILLLIPSLMCFPLPKPNTSIQLAPSARLIRGPASRALEIRAFSKQRRCKGGRETDVHVGMGENEAVAVDLAASVS